jgi:AcrR family transcriptional regulator
MAKAFTETEKSAVKHLLNLKGAELFSRLGLKKTTVEDITRATGIGR